MIFRQTRIGKGGVPFTLYKIETMKDGEVTRPRLRKSGLDELPQIVNIIKGDMALFGPRPEVPEIHQRASELMGETWDARTRVKPGLLSLASVVGGIRGPDRFAPEVKTEQAVLDNVMIDAMNLAMRFQILRRLPLTILKGQTG